MTRVAPMSDLPDRLLLLVDPTTREALRLGGPDPQTMGPVFFTSREALDGYAKRHGITGYTVSEVPSGVLARMRGLPYWVDGEEPPRPPKRPPGGRRPGKPRRPRSST